MHPGAWLVWTLSATLVAISTTNPFYLVPLIAVSWFVYAARHSPESPQRGSFRLFLLVGLAAVGVRTALVLFGDVSKEALAAAALEGLRLAALLAVYGAFNAVSNPYRFLRLAPRRFHEPALAAALALSIAPRTVEAVARVKEAQRMRGIRVARWRSVTALAVPVLESGMEEALMLAESMDARGHGRAGRSRYRPEHWSVASSVSAVTSAGAVATFLVFGASGLGGLSVSTYPLELPPASMLLVGAVMLLTVPALLPERLETTA
jgi:energy-coupling factor transport system permease protein